MYEWYHMFLASGVGIAINELIRWLIDRRGWWTCPISTCDFRFRLQGFENDNLATTLKRDHILTFHEEKEAI